MPAKKTPKKVAPKKTPKKAEKTIFEGEAVKKVEAETKEAIHKGGKWLKNFKREENILKILGVVLLLIGLRQLREWLLGLILIIFGILFLTGYFDKKGKK